MKRVTVVLIAVFLLSACATAEEHFARETSGVIGCPAKEITITNVQRDFSYMRYSAECRGKKYRCSQWGPSSDPHSTPPQCKEETK